MPQVEFEPKISVFERVKTVHALDSAVAATGLTLHDPCNLDGSFSKPFSLTSIPDTHIMKNGGTKSNNYLLIREHIPWTN
jgi:hypothetical protein